MEKSVKKNLWFIPHSQNHFAKMNLFCFHHAGGSASFFYDWPLLLTPFVNLISVQLPGRDTRHSEPFLMDINSILKELIEHIEIFTEKPFALFGHSLGSIIAFELVRQLQKFSLADPKCLIVSGRCAPELSDSQEKIFLLPDTLFIKRLIEKYGGISEDVQRSSELIKLLLPRLRADIYLAENYRYLPETPLECPVYVMSGSHDQSVKHEDLLGWQKEAKAKIKSYHFDGDHFFIDSNKKNVLDRINRLLAVYL